jgi:hypothetical protein
MGVSERAEFFAWYEEQNSMSVVFNNRQTLQSYCQDDVVLRQACQVFRNEFIRVGNIDVFQESLTIASPCNKALRRLIF